MYSKTVQLILAVLFAANLVVTLVCDQPAAQVQNRRQCTVRFIELYSGGDKFGTISQDLLEQRMNAAAQGGHLVSLQCAILSRRDEHRGVREVRA